VERYQAVRQLALKNVPHLHIARRLHLSRSTVIRYAKAEQFPERPHHPPRPGVLTPYEPYLYARWKEGQVKAVPLFREIVAQGYKGSRMSVQRYILGLRQQPKDAQQTPVLSATIEMTPHRVVGLLLQPAETLTESERTALNHVRTLHPHITRALSLFEDFHQMILTRRGEALPNWMAAAFHCGLPEFRAFVNKLCQDQQAVQTGLVLHWNNGPVEGQVTRLKLLKRQAYGRAGFDLLRLRVLHRRSLSPDPAPLTFLLATALPSSVSAVFYFCICLLSKRAHLIWTRAGLWGSLHSIIITPHSLSKAISPGWLTFPRNIFLRLLQYSRYQKEVQLHDEASHRICWPFAYCLAPSHIDAVFYPKKA